MAERRYKPTPENERLVQQFIESSKRAGYDPTFTNIIVKEVKKDKTGKVRNRIASAQRKVEAKVPGLVAPGKDKSKDDVEARKRRFREMAKSYKKAELHDLYKEGAKDVGKFLLEAGLVSAATAATMGVGGAFTIKALQKLPLLSKAIKAKKTVKFKRKPKTEAGKPKPKELPPGRRGPDAVDPDEIIPPKGPGTRVQRRPRKEPEIIDAEVVQPAKRIAGRRGLPSGPQRKALPPRQSYKQPPAKPVRRLESRKPRLEDPAEKGLRLKAKGKTMKQIAEETGKTPAQIRSAMRRRTGTHTPFRKQLGLKDAPSSKLEKFLRNQKINTAKKLRDQFPKLRQELIDLGMPARARELSQLLNQAGR